MCTSKSVLGTACLQLEQLPFIKRHLFTKWSRILMHPLKTFVSPHLSGHRTGGSDLHNCACFWASPYRKISSQPFTPHSNFKSAIKFFTSLWISYGTNTARQLPQSLALDFFHLSSQHFWQKSLWHALHYIGSTATSKQLGQIMSLKSERCGSTKLSGLSSYWNILSPG